MLVMEVRRAVREMRCLVAEDMKGRAAKRRRVTWKVMAREARGAVMSQKEVKRRGPVGLKMGLGLAQVGCVCSGGVCV
jgi:hypothetical protein